MATQDVLYSYAGKILRINLSDKNITTQPTSDYAKDWLGGSGIAIKILYDELRPWMTPFDPSNKLVFGSGTLLGTVATGACKSNISTLGPMTGGWASGLSDSYVGAIQTFNRYGHFKTVVGDETGEVMIWKTPVGITIDDRQRLYVVEMIPNRVGVYQILDTVELEVR